MPRRRTPWMQDPAHAAGQTGGERGPLVDSTVDGIPHQNALTASLTTPYMLRVSGTVTNLRSRTGASMNRLDVDGIAYVGGEADATTRRVWADELRELCQKLGLRVLERPWNGRTRLSEAAAKRKRWTWLPLRRQDVVDLVYANPGVSVADLRNRLLRPPQGWGSEEIEAHATRKVHNLLNILAKQYLGEPAIIKRVDGDGTIRLYPPEGFERDDPRLKFLVIERPNLAPPLNPANRIDELTLEQRADIAAEAIDFLRGKGIFFANPSDAHQMVEIMIRKAMVFSSTGPVNDVNTDPTDS